jgi:hypothetical protein
MNKFTNNILIILILKLAGCITIPPSPELGEPNIQKNKIFNEIILNKVEVNTDDNGKVSLEENLTLNIKDYLQKGNYASNIILFNQVDDTKLKNKILSIKFNNYIHERKPHPDYFLYAFITLTFYIWLGGDIYADEANYACEIKLLDNNEKTIIENKEEIKEIISVNIYSEQYIFPDSRKTRTKILEKTLEGLTTKK